MYPSGTLTEAQALAKLVGEAPAFLEAIRHLPAIAQSDADVLVIGETGTGKELVARATHYLSRRAGFPFVALNCGSFPESLMEVELFGHERGAFTDARTRRLGLLSQAENGTLLLDEVDTLPSKAQIDLLRFLQDRHYRVLGSNDERRANVRIITATNASIPALAESGGFRQDLYYRLSVFTVLLPPLRDRASDIPILVEHFLRKHTPPGRQVPRLSNDATARLLLHRWPGNVRELENAMIRGIHLSKNGKIEINDLGLPLTKASADADLQPPPEGNADFSTMKRRAIQSFERSYLTKLMIEHSGNISVAARASGKERRDLGRLLKKYDMQAKSFHRRLAN